MPTASTARESVRVFVRQGARVINRVRTAPHLLTLISTVATVCAFYVPGLWWVIFFALVPFIHAVRISQVKGVILLGAVFGTVLLGSATSATLWAAPPPSAGAVDPLPAFLLVALSWLLFFLPLVPTVTGWAILVASVKKLSIFSAAGLSAAFAALEWARMAIFNIATYAPGVENPLFFSAGTLGYVVADASSWLQLAALGGVYLMSAVVVFVNLLLYRCIQSGLKSGCLLICALLLTVTWLPFSSWRDMLESRNESVLTVAFMSLYRERPEVSMPPLVPAEGGAAPNTDLVVLPEGIAADAIALQSVVNAKTAVISTQGEVRGDEFANVAYAQYAGEGSPVPVRAKSVLAAQGEYIAGVFLVLAKMTGIYTEQLARHMTTAAWSNPFSIGSLETPVSVLFCVEMLKPGFAKTLKERDGSELVVVPMSHLQFQGAPTLRVDTLRFLKVRAVEAGLPLVASGNSTPGYALSRYGEIIAQAGTTGESEVVQAPVTVLSTAAP